MLRTLSMVSQSTGNRFAFVYEELLDVVGTYEPLLLGKCSPSPALLSCFSMLHTLMDAPAGIFRKQKLTVALLEEAEEEMGFLYELMKGRKQWKLSYPQTFARYLSLLPWLFVEYSYILGEGSNSLAHHARLASLIEAVCAEE